MQKGGGGSLSEEMGGARETIPVFKHKGTNTQLGRTSKLEQIYLFIYHSFAVAPTAVGCKCPISL